ncbi:MAG: FAD-dependent oxidoreductase [Burkholderiaceae bacterium]|nr:FAD-dependent oxidoreductase [Burkholderiaceae bacterium]
MTPPESSAATCDVLIVGAGPAGLAAALAAAPSGARIVVLDDNPRPGGQLWRHGPCARPPQAAERMLKALEGQANVGIQGATRVLGPVAGEGGAQALLLENPERGWTQHFKTLILCTGARERLLPFPGWTLPGVTGAGGLQALIKGGLPVRGQRIVIAGSGPLLLAAAATARAHGAQIVCVAEQAPLKSLAAFAAHLPRWPGKAWQALTLLEPRLCTSSHVIAAHGQDQLSAVTLQRNGRQIQLDCERLACGFGLVPNVALGQMLGCEVGVNAHGEQVLNTDQWQRTSLPGILAAGECTGFGGGERAQAQGRIAGHVAVGQMSAAGRQAPERRRWERFAALLHRHFSMDPHLKSLPEAGTLVCRCEDVPHAQMQAHADWTMAKMHTRCGMGACQGRICGTAAQFLYGWTPPTPRWPLVPARLSTLAGQFDPDDPP